MAREDNPIMNDLGFRKFDPEGIKKVKKFLSLESKINTAKNLEEGVLEKAGEILSSEYIKKYWNSMSVREMRDILDNLKEVGYPVKDYSGLELKELRAYFHGIPREIKVYSTLRDFR